MSLPTLSTKTIDIKLPVCGKKIKFRPFTVKEQKNLLLAVDQSETLKNKELENFLISEFKNIISSCLIDSPIEINDMYISDFLYLMLQLRSASVGDILELTYTCPCNTKVDFTVDLEKVELKNKKKSYETNIHIDEDIYVTMDFLTVKDVSEITESDPADILINTIVKSIKKIYDKDTVYISKDFSHEDLLNFVEQIPVEKIKEIESFFESTPYLVYQTEIDCPGKKVKLEVMNLSDFFY